jgi:hypothetical protein
MRRKLKMVSALITVMARSECGFWFRLYEKKIIENNATKKDRKRMGLARLIR